ncbi:hypothetical protein M011DRAFT_456576 [Sporormia fimetaria CBS 119925]|uniref:Uncharacterized protein n=1 Tax=Sporormia fimetaria CBS 119925 TaxID=1340428 RepID=A0A6A6VKU1_9PLEO|nr:hypothetical protein M011DRAFT_456576 [Sporormia fimetaria CBS 119925]
MPYDLTSHEDPLHSGHDPLPLQQFYPSGRRCCQVYHMYPNGVTVLCAYETREPRNPLPGTEPQTPLYCRGHAYELEWAFSGRLDDNDILDESEILDDNDILENNDILDSDDEPSGFARVLRARDSLSPLYRTSRSVSPVVTDEAAAGIPVCPYCARSLPSSVRSTHGSDVGYADDVAYSPGRETEVLPSGSGVRREHEGGRYGHHTQRPQGGIRRRLRRMFSGRENGNDDGWLSGHTHSPGGDHERYGEGPSSLEGSFETRTYSRAAKHGGH